MDIPVTELVDLHNALQSAFGKMSWLPIVNGQIHRFHVPGDRSSTQNGWYVAFPGEITLACYGSWKTGSTYRWSSRRTIGRLENLLIRQRIEQVQQQHEAELKKRQRAAAGHSRSLWINARCADPQHPYLLAKGCNPHDLRQNGNTLLVPLYHAGRLVNLQRISETGEKRFLKGGRIKGSYSLIGIIESGKALFLCEGWATGATLHEETGAAVACAMNSGNLLSAGQHLQHQHPDATLIVAGDDDRQTDGNPGSEAAARAALALDCGLMLPQWPADAPTSLSDYNDLRQWLRANQ